MSRSPTHHWPALAYRPYRSAQRWHPTGPNWHISKLGDVPQEYLEVEKNVVPRYRFQLSALRDNIHVNRANVMAKVGRLGEINDRLHWEIGQVQRVYELQMRAHMERPLDRKCPCKR